MACTAQTQSCWKTSLGGTVRSRDPFLPWLGRHCHQYHCCVLVLCSRIASLATAAPVWPLIVDRAIGVCVEPFPTHSYDGGLFEARRCLLVDRALTGTLDGKTVEMEGDGTHAGGIELI